MLMGKGVLKSVWSEAENDITCTPIATLYFVVPPYTKEIQKADWCCEIQVYSEDEYRRNKNFKQDEELIERIKGGERDSINDYEENKYEREGLTRSQNPDDIIVWEFYEKKKDGKISVKFITPSGDEVRSSIKDLSVVNDHNEYPYTEFNYEENEEGYYASQGLADESASFEMYLCKVWNSKSDAMTLYNRPYVFSPTGSKGNLANNRLIPGQVFTGELGRLQMGEPPISFDQEMMNTRAIAEQAIGVPDFAMGQKNNALDSRTATEINSVMALTSQSVGRKSRLYKRSLGKLYRQLWYLLRKYKKDDLSFYFRNELMEIPASVFDNNYIIEPSISGDNWNKQMNYQKAVARMQMLAGNAYIDQGKLIRNVLEQDDPRLVRQLFIDAGQQKQDQMEDQAEEISSMLIGFPSQVKPTDDDATHLTSMAGFIQRRMQTQEGMPPELAALLLNHGMMHFQALQKKQPEVAKQMQQQLQPMMQALMEASGVGQQQQMQNGQQIPQRNGTMREMA